MMWRNQNEPTKIIRYTKGGIAVVKKIQLTQGKYALVDDEDYEFVNSFKWYYGQGYACRNERLPDGNRKTIKMHRVIAKTPEDKQTDHINRNTLDNRKSNLRNVDQKDNAKNADKKSKATSEYKGVSYFKRKQDKYGKWKANIQVDGKKINLGYFDSEIEAALKYNEAAKKYFGEFAVLNKLDLMELHQYQQLAARTMPKDKWFNTNISNYSMGLAGECGELVDIFKKVIHHGHKLDLDDIKKEMGDCLWYLAALATTLKIDLDEVASMNINKLIKRYPNGFSTSDSLKRVDTQAELFQNTGY